MRRLLRWTFNTLAAASLLLCLATAGLGVRSYWAGDELYAHRVEASDPSHDHHVCFIWSYRGRFSGVFGRSDRPGADPIPSWEFQFTHVTGGPPALLIDVGFSAFRDVHEGYAYNGQFWAVPAWSLVFAFAVLPAVLVLRELRAARRRQRSRLGLCPGCGYDLRASPERCPECGREGG